MTADNDTSEFPAPGNPPDRSDIDELQAILGERYQLQWIIGRGGMSTVWLAKDTHAPKRDGHGHGRGWRDGHGRGKSDGQDVAIKILRPEYTENEEFRTRFRNESEASKELDSPNVVATYDYGEIQTGDPGFRTMAFCYIVMEYVKGESLADVLAREKTLPENLVADLLAQAATGLEEIHTSGMVHRDIKPGNILITADGVAKITDFGISKAAEAVPLTRTGMVVGTAQYVSPEQAQGLQVGPASDVYSLGVVGYECLAGRRPFSGESTVSVAIKHISEDPAPLPPEISPYMREFIGVCLRKSPVARYANGSEMSSAIALVAQGQRPPQPHNVPEVDTEHPLTEQLGAVATGPGTAVPPVQGPPQAAGAMAGGAMAGGAMAGSSPEAGAMESGASRSASPQKKSNTPVVLLVLLAVVACAIAGYMFLTSRDNPTPEQETTTITNEVTTPNTDGDTSNQAPPVQSTLIVTEDPTTEDPGTVEPSTEDPATQEPTSEQPSQQPSSQRPTSQQPSQSTGNGQTGGNGGGTTGGGNTGGGSTGGNGGNTDNTAEGAGETANEPMIEGAASTVDSTMNATRDSSRATGASGNSGNTGNSAGGGTSNPAT